MVRKAKKIEFMELKAIESIHKLRWEMHHKRGMTVEQIAAEHGVLVNVIRKSIARVEAQLQTYTLNDTVRLQHEKAQAVHVLETNMLKEALGATVPIIVNGKVIRREPDLTTRLRAFELMTQRIGSVTPRKGLEINASRTEQHLHLQAGGANPHGAPAAGRGFEDILRKISSSQRALPEAIVNADFDIPMMSEDELAADDAIDSVAHVVPDSTAKQNE